MMHLDFFSRLDTPAETNSEFTPENGWLEEDSFLLGWPIFNGELLVSGSVVDYKKQLLENFLFTQWIPDKTNGCALGTVNHDFL